MPEYLSPGVYIEELPPQLRAIEGVSTSTAGFVGVTQRGPVPGFVLPFTPLPTDPQVVTLVPDPTPVLVTSFADFTRQFGSPLPLPDPTNNSYLGYAVQAFFANGGLRAYISRVISPTANYGGVGLTQGVVLPLATSVVVNTLLVALNSVAAAVQNLGAALNDLASATLPVASGESSLTEVTNNQAKVTSALSILTAAIAENPISQQLTTALSTVTTAANSAFATATTACATAQSATGTPAALVADQLSVIANFTSISGAITASNSDLIAMAGGTNASIGTIAFTALRGISNGQPLAFYHKDGTPVAGLTGPLKSRVNTYMAATSQVTLDPPIDVNLNADDVYAVPEGIGTLTSQGPFFWACNPGAWSSLLSVAVTPTRRRTVAIVAAAAANATVIQVASTSGFYVGAIVEIDIGTEQIYAVVLTIGTGSLALTEPLGVAVALSAAFVPTARIIEIDIAIVDSSPAVPITESFTGLTWNPDANPSVRARHYSTIVNAQSNLVFVEPPGVGSVNGVQFGGSEDASIESQPTSFNGLAISITGANNAIAPLQALLNSVSAAVQQLATDLASLATAAQTAGTLPLTSSSPMLVSLASDQTAVNNAIAAAASVVPPRFGPAAGLAAAITTVNSAATTASATAGSAITTATTNPTGAAATLAANQTSVNGKLATITAAITSANAATNIVVGSDGTEVTDDDYVGVDNGPGQRSGIQSLIDADDISIIAAPGQTDQEVQNELIDQCELLRYRFAVLDGEQTPAGGSVNAILAHRQQYDTSYAAYYAPWVAITLNNQSLYLPPSGHMIGIYAGTDNSRGVQKAPANVVVQNITGLKYSMTKGEQDILNPAGVNLIRRFTATGTRIWGARTMSSDTSLMYVNVRRTLIYLEASIDQGTQWVVFEPNTPDTWDRLTDSITAFLTTQWVNGVLFGAKAEDSFFVRCDETTMTADDIQNGRLICNIGVAIVRPAEFVIFRIEQTTGYANQ